MIKFTDGEAITRISQDEPLQNYPAVGDVYHKRERCPMCKGHGGHNGIKCPVCYGKKVVYVPAWLIIRPKAR